MNRNPLYQQILERLNGKLDSDLFEACAADILRQIYPSLVPMRGGNDAGMDGAIGDGEGEPFQLVSTTEEDVIGNITKSLKSYLSSGRKRRKLVLATSQYLTPRRIQNLYNRAAELGFSLVQVHSQDAMANLLFNSPDWCRELLNLTGRPSALSIFPMTNRPAINQSLVGREKDLAWLMDATGDRLLVGHPGSGKTYLLQKYVNTGKGLFVVSENLGEIAAAYRSQQPSVLIMDDVQLNLSLISKLLHYREENGASFSIVASCWFTDLERVSSAMTLANDHIYTLELLSRDEIVAVIKDAGVIGPNELVHEIVNQAEGRPGLAATLVHLCLQGNVRKVTIGDALSSSVRNFFEPRLGTQAVELLAAFSIGGDRGMSLQAVAGSLSMSLTEVRSAAVHLSSGGILWESNEQRLAVHPLALRHALVRDVFFQGALSMPILPLLNLVPDFSEAAQTLTGAYARGARIPWNDLVDILEKANSVRVWQNFSRQGANEARWVLENHPELALDIAESALEYVPEVALPMLLRLAVGDNRELHATPEHPLRLIDDWVKAAWPGQGIAVKKRNILSKAAFEWIRQGADLDTGLKAIQSAFSPTCGDLIIDPGAGNTVTIREAFLLPEEMTSIQNLWSGMVEILKGQKISYWQPLKEIVRTWAYPYLTNIKLPDETRNQMRSFARELLVGVMNLAENRQGILHWAKQISHDADLSVDVQIDPEFEMLYPIEYREEYQEAEDKHRLEVVKLANSWGQRRPEEIAQKIARIEKEAYLTDVRWPRWTIYLCMLLSQFVDEPLDWVEVFVAEDIPAELISPFLEKTAEKDEPGWIDLVKKCIQQPNYKAVAIAVALTAQTTPDELTKEALINLDGLERVIEILCLRGQLPVETVRRLLTHTDPLIRSAAAQGEWYAEPKASTRESLLPEWKSAVIGSRDDHFVSLIVQNDHELAYGWLKRFLQDKIRETYRFDRSIQVAANALEYEDKIRLLDLIPDDWVYGDLIYCLVGNDLAFYRALLGSNGYIKFHLVPLTWEDSEVWIDKTKMALDKGYSSREIASAAYGYPLKSVSWWGHESNMRKEWVERFDKLCSHKDERVREIGSIGKANAETKYQRALRDERDEEVFGIR